MTPSSPEPLLLVGSQRGALRALDALGRSAIVVLRRGRRCPSHPAVESVCEVDLHGPVAAIEETVRARLGDRRPVAVVALAERTVVVAAHLRAALGVSGNSPATALACADKVVMKLTMESAGIATAPWCEIGRGTTSGELVEALGLPLVIKPRRDSGGRQQQRFDDLETLDAALARIAAEPPGDGGYGWLAEGWIEGTEMSVESFVHLGRPVFANPTEYFVRRHANILPAALDEGTWREVREFAERANLTLGIRRGITHLEVFRTSRGLVFGELASRPPGGRLMQLLARAWNFDPWTALLRLELGDPVTFPDTATRTAGVWILHPGAGTLTALHGIDDARNVPGIRRIALKVEVGDRIGERLGAGADVCAVYAEGESRDAVATSLSSAVERIRFELS